MYNWCYLFHSYTLGPSFTTVNRMQRYSWSFVKSLQQQTTRFTQCHTFPPLCWKMHFLDLNVDVSHLLLHEVTFYSDLFYFSPHFVNTLIGTYTQNVSHQNSRKFNEWFRRRQTGTSWLTSFQYTQFQIYGILNQQKNKKTKFETSWIFPCQHERAKRQTTRKNTAGR